MRSSEKKVIRSRFYQTTAGLAKVLQKLRVKLKCASYSISTNDAISLKIFVFFVKNPAVRNEEFSKTYVRYSQKWRLLHTAHLSTVFQVKFHVCFILPKSHLVNWYIPCRKNIFQMSVSMRL